MLFDDEEGPDCSADIVTTGGRGDWFTVFGSATGVSELRRYEDGFTLVELMVVVLIIGVLVSIAIPVFSAVSGTASLRTCQSNQRTIEGACQTYRAYTGDLWTTSAVFDGNNTTDTVDQLASKYFLDPPKCPKTRQYYYVTSSGDVTGDTNAAAWTGNHYHY